MSLLVRRLDSPDSPSQAEKQSLPSVPLLVPQLPTVFICLVYGVLLTPTKQINATDGIFSSTDACTLVWCDYNVT